MNEGLVEMFRYNAWANRRLFEACRSLTEEQLDLRAPGISGSIRELLMHIAGGQQTFILRTMGRQHEDELARGSDWPGMEPVIEIANDTSDKLLDIAMHLQNDEDVALSYQDKRVGQALRPVTFKRNQDVTGFDPCYVWTYSGPTPITFSSPGFLSRVTMRLATPL